MHKTHHHRYGNSNRRIPVPLSAMPTEKSAFRSNDEILEIACLLFHSRKSLTNKESASTDLDGLRKAERRITRLWHERLRVTPPAIPLLEIVTKHLPRQDASYTTIAKCRSL